MENYLGYRVADPPVEGEHDEVNAQVWLKPENFGHGLALMNERTTFPLSRRLEQPLRYPLAQIAR